MLALAKALVLDGWDVHFFTSDKFRRQVEHSGARWCHYGAEDWDLFSAAERVALQRLQVEPDEELFTRMMPYAVVPATLDVLPYLIGRMAQLRPRFILYDAACPWGWVLSEALAIPGICSMTALPAPMPERETSSSTEWSSARVLDATSAAVRSAYGVELNHNYSYANYSDYTITWTSRSWHKGNDEFPEGRFHYWGSLLADRDPSAAAGAGDVEAALAGLAGRPLVFVSMGTVATGPLFSTFAPSLEDFYGKVCAVAESMPEAAFIFALGTSTPTRRADDGHIAEIFDGVRIPPNATAAVRVDQLEVLERASVFVTHCGMNSSSETIAKGVPVVAVPFFGDQIDNAERFRELGCGALQRYTRGRHARLQWEPDHSLITEASLASAIGGVLADGRYRRAVQDLRAREAEECGRPLAEKVADMVSWADSRPPGRVFA